MKTIFIGRSLSALVTLYEQTDLVHVLSEKDKTPDSIFNFCKSKYIAQTTIFQDSDIGEVIFNHKITDSALMSASCGIIFSQNSIDLFESIINFHPGDIFTCRGATPLLFAIQKRLPFMGFTSHIINSSLIDCGPIIYQNMLPINYEKSYGYNEKLLFSILPETILATVKIVENPSFSPLKWFNRQENKYNLRLSLEEYQKITTAPSLNEALKT